MTTERTGPLEPFVYNGQSRDQIPEDVEHLIVDSSVEEIPPEAFRRFGSLAKVEIKSGVQTIGQMAFRGCTNLTEVAIQSGVQTIGRVAFCGCDNLTEVVIPSTVVQIGDWAFYQCEDLQKVVLPMGLTQIGAYAFAGCSTLTEIIIPSTVTELWMARIWWQSFDGCGNLQSIDIKGGDNLPLAIRLSTQYPTKTPNITMSFLVSQYFFHRITALDLLEPVGYFDDDDQKQEQCMENEGEKLEEIKSAFVEHLRLLVEWRVCSGNFMAITNRKRKAED